MAIPGLYFGAIAQVVKVRPTKKGTNMCLLEVKRGAYQSFFSNVFLSKELSDNLEGAGIVEGKKIKVDAFFCTTHEYNGRPQISITLTKVSSPDKYVPQEERKEKEEQPVNTNGGYWDTIGNFDSNTPFT